MVHEPVNLVELVRGVAEQPARATSRMTEHPQDRQHADMSIRPRFVAGQCGESGQLAIPPHLTTAPPRRLEPLAASTPAEAGISTAVGRRRET